MNKKNMKQENKVKTGPTTGSLATAAALASLLKITKNKNTNKVKIKTPTTILNIEIKKIEEINKNKVKTTCIKYPYSDPDVTVGLEINATVELEDKKNKKEETIKITGGKGVGTITKPGLQIPIGESAINPVPRKMIIKNLEKHVPKNKIAKVTISIPKGEEIANKTMNPRLGIKKGISILGTTGVAKAMDEDAYKQSIVKQIDIAKAEGIKELVFVPGNIGEKLALKNLKITKEQIIQTGNYIGFMFEEAEKRNIKEFTFFGHIGKLVKVAGGIFNTKHAIADCRCEIFAAHTALINCDKKLIKSIFNSQTTEEIIDILKKENIDEIVINNIAKSIKIKCLDRFNLDLNVILVDMEGNILNSNYNDKLIK